MWDTPEARLDEVPLDRVGFRNSIRKASLADSDTPVLESSMGFEQTLLYCSIMMFKFVSARMPVNIVEPFQDRYSARGVARKAIRSQCARHDARHLSTCHSLYVTVLG